MSKLEESKKYLKSTFTDDNYEIVLCEDIGIPRELLTWLIKEAEKVGKIEYEIDNNDMTEGLENIIRIVKG